MNINDRVNYSTAHLQQVGVWPHALREDGHVTGTSGRFVMVQWPEDSEPTAVAPESLTVQGSLAPNEAAPGFSPEYGNWEGCHRSKRNAFRKFRAKRQAEGTDESWGWRRPDMSWSVWASAVLWRVHRRSERKFTSKLREQWRASM